MEIDDWESWEDSDLILPQIKLTKSTELLRHLEERRLVEESDNNLTKDLFASTNESKKLKNYSEEEQEDDPFMKNHTILFPLTIKMPSIVKLNKTTNPKKSFQILNEQKQKEQSKVRKNMKAEKAKADELYGESDYYDEYADYY
jgi:transposase